MVTVDTEAEGRGRKGDEETGTAMYPTGPGQRQGQGALGTHVMARFTSLTCLSLEIRSTQR